MQGERSQLDRSLNRSVFFICLLVFPSLAGLLLVAPILVEIIPRYSKWAPALTPLTFIVFASMFAAVTTQLTNLLNAIGKIKVTFKLMVMWTALTWLIIPYLAITHGVTGASIGYMLVSSTSVIALFLVKKYVDFSLDFVFKPLISAVFMFVVVAIIKNFLPENIIGLLIVVTAGIIIYSLTTYLLVGSSLAGDVKKSFQLLLRR